MLAVPKDEAMEFVRYEGRDAVYPLWFLELEVEGLIFERHSCMFYVSEKGDIAMAHGDVILINKYGQTMYMESRVFNELFYEVQ